MEFLREAIAQALSVGITNAIFTVIAILILDRVGRASPTLKHDASWIALVCLIAYIASFAIGLGPVFWLMISEIFPLKVCSAAMSVSTVANWSSNFLVATFFLTLTGAITIQGTFWLYAGFKDRSLEEISHEVSTADDSA
jgi:hypothetical protein